MEGLIEIKFWYWLIAAVVMIILEMLLPAAYFLWMSVSAFIVGLLLLMIPEMPHLVQVIVFGVISILTLVLYKKYQKDKPDRIVESNLNRRGEQYVGRQFILQESIVGGYGKIKVDDAIWKISGADLPAGTSVRVIRVEDAVFIVEPQTMMANAADMFGSNNS